MRRLLALLAGVLAIPLAFSLLLAPAAEASVPRPTPSTYVVSRTFGPFDGETTSPRRIAVSCRNVRDVIVAHRATINRDSRRVVIRLRDVRVSNDDRTFRAVVLPLRRPGTNSVTLSIRCQRDRDRILRRDDRGPVPTPLLRRQDVLAG